MAADENETVHQVTVELEPNDAHVILCALSAYGRAHLTEDLAPIPEHLDVLMSVIAAERSIKLAMVYCALLNNGTWDELADVYGGDAEAARADFLQWVTMERGLPPG